VTLYQTFFYNPDGWQDIRSIVGLSRADDPPSTDVGALASVFPGLDDRRDWCAAFAVKVYLN
jgi:hypothetical protein